MADWKSGHKKACKIQQILNDAQKTLKVDPPARPPVGRCTGCNMKFSSTDRDYYCESSCEACGYQACESCACHSSRGACSQPCVGWGYADRGTQGRVTARTRTLGTRTASACRRGIMAMDGRGRCTRATGIRRTTLVTSRRMRMKRSLGNAGTAGKWRTC